MKRLDSNHSRLPHEAPLWARYRRIGVLAHERHAYRHLLQFPLFAYSLLSPRTESFTGRRSDGHPPLLLLHGLGGNRGQLSPLAWYLACFGRSRSYRLGFAADADLESLSRQCAESVNEVIHLTGESRVDIVAHSLGGIVARLAIHDHRLEQKVKTLVTLGTPHHGTLTARYGRSPLCRHLEPSSVLMRRLRATPWPTPVRGVALWSRHDLIVVPGRTAVFPGMEDVDMSPFTHFSYLLDPRGWEAVRRALKG